MTFLYVNGPLFGEKLCAALDRQHPRDFFDLHMFLNDFSYTRELHQAFIVYLLRSKRPLSELIQSNCLNIKPVYEKQFKGMTSLEISCEQLEKTREDIFTLTQAFFNDQEKEFLLSFKRGDPQWELFPIKNVQNFPAVQWKLGLNPIETFLANLKNKINEIIPTVTKLSQAIDKAFNVFHIQT